MTIIRVTSGASGIAEYLEHGSKKGRNYARDELDLRVILSGDLHLTDEVIKAMETREDAQRYLHITQAFKEDVIAPETLAAISERNRNFYLSAWGDRLNYYEEAHNPKIKNYIDENGNTVDRLPHTHSVIPLVDLDTGKRADPLGYSTAKYGSKWSNNDFIRAHQELINLDFGLASPIENQRVQSGRSNMIERYKVGGIREQTPEQIARSKRDQLKQEVMREIIARDITKYDQYLALLAEHGEVSKGFAKTADGDRAVYYKVKLAGDTKHARFDEKMFSREFINLTTEEKKKILDEQNKHEFIEAKSPEQIAAEESEAIAARRAECEEMIDYWHNVRAREIRYIHPDSKYFKEVYRDLSTEERIKVLDRLERGERVVDNEATLAPTSSRFNSYTAEQQESNLEHGKLILAGDREAIRTMLDDLTKTESSFVRGDLEAYLIARMDVADVADAIEKIAADNYFVVNERTETKEIDGEEQEVKTERYTSRSVYDIEQQMIAAAERLKSGTAAEISFNRKTVETLNEGQMAAFKAMVSGQQIALVNGAAGTGKSYLLAKFNEAAKADGYETYGAILQGKTAEDLERDSGIKSSTLHSFLMRVDSGKIQLNDKSIIIVDEAGMVGSEQLGRVMQLCETYGCRSVMVGDVYQLDAVAYGSAFDKLSNVFGVSSLTQIKRQEIKWQNDASIAMSTHNIEGGLDAYNEHGNILFEKNQLDAIDVIAARVREDRQQGKGDAIVIARKNDDRITLNKKIREDLIADGVVSSEEQSFVLNKKGRRIDIATGDRIMFMSPNKAIGVKNGTSGKITGIGADSIYIESDGKTIQVPRESDLDLDLAYAVTIHKSQGQTIQRSYFLADKDMNANQVYVAMTRHKRDAILYASEEHFKDYDDLVKKGSRKSTKEFAGLDEQVEADQTLIDRMVSDQQSEQLIAREADRTKTLKTEIDLRNLLIKLENDTGLDIDKFRIDKETNRIIAGRKEYDAVQFLTKIMHKDYETEAMPYLREAYRGQLKQAYAERKEPAAEYERRDFAKWTKARNAEYERKDRALQEAMRQPKADARLSGDDARLEVLQAQLDADRKALKREYIKPNRILFDDFRNTAEQIAKREALALALKEQQQQQQQEQQSTTNREEQQHGHATDGTTDDWQPHNRPVETSTQPPAAIRARNKDRVLDLSASDLVLNLERDGLPLQQAVSDRLEEQPADRDHRVQRSAQEAEGMKASVIPAMTQSQIRALEARAKEEAASQARIDEAMKRLQAKAKANKNQLSQADIERAKIEPVREDEEEEKDQDQYGHR